MTFAEFEQLPDPKDGRYELRHGIPVEVRPSRLKHSMLRERLRDLLDQVAVKHGRAFTRLGFRTPSEFEYRVADIAFTSAERLVRQDPNQYFEGAPDLVIEVLSPSNSEAEIADMRTLCFETGCREFWTVDIGDRWIDVSTPDRHTVTYKAGQEIPLIFGGRIPVDAIFSART
jgi:Uma2 family endonuclease